MGGCMAGLHGGAAWGGCMVGLHGGAAAHDQGSARVRQQLEAAAPAHPLDVDQVAPLRMPLQAHPPVGRRALARGLRHVAPRVRPAHAARVDPAGVRLAHGDERGAARAHLDVARPEELRVLGRRRGARRHRPREGVVLVQPDVPPASVDEVGEQPVALLARADRLHVDEERAVGREAVTRLRKGDVVDADEHVYSPYTLAVERPSHGTQLRLGVSQL